MTSYIEVYLTTDSNNMLIKQEEIKWQQESTGNNTIHVEADKTYQMIDGFGASFTDASAYLVHEVLDAKMKNTVMEKLFSKEKGIGLSFIRQPIGASDYACSIYSYQDTPDGKDDFEFKYFTIDHDKKYILPLLKQMMQINPNVKLMATPWSAPGWMKTTGDMIGGTLREDCYEAFSEYLVRVIKAYQEEGLELYAVSPQNEPMYVPDHYPGMRLDAMQEAKLIKDYLGPKIKHADIHTKLLCYDHNWDMPEYPLTVLEQAGEYIDGVAWHVYAAHPNAQSIIVERFPNKEVYYNEASGGEWIPPFEKAFFSMMHTNIGTLRHYSKTIVLWNIALDEQNGPTVPGFGRSTCRGLVTINQQTKEVTYNLDYYVLAHFSRFVESGAYRIQSNEVSQVSNVAFKNPDGSIVMVMSNDSEEEKVINIKYDENYCSYKILPKSAVTLKW